MEVYKIMSSNNCCSNNCCSNNGIPYKVSNTLLPFSCELWSEQNKKQIYYLQNNTISNYTNSFTYFNI